MKLSRRHAVLGFMALGGGVALSGRAAVTATRPGTAFGTTVHLTITARSSADAELAIDLGFQEIRAVEKAFNIFDAKSEISILNANGYLHHPSRLMLDVIQHSSEIFRQTNGAFDPTVQPLWSVWQRAVRNASLPDHVQIMRASANVSWSNLIVEDNLLRLKDKGSALTFNGIAQGYAADRVITAIQHLALSAVVDTGEVGLSSGDKIPKLAIQHPRNPDGVAGYVTAQSGFVATSGDYATTFTPDFLHHHIFDPSLGASPRELSAVTVLAPTGALADGLATAFMVMGVERSLQLVEKTAGVETLLITKQGGVVLSAGMKNYFQSA
jgi:FAD:protein FMN transferase